MHDDDDTFESLVFDPDDDHELAEPAEPAEPDQKYNRRRFLRR